MNIAKSFFCLAVLISLFCVPERATSAAEATVPEPEPQWIWTPVQDVGNMPNGACFFRRTFLVSRRPWKVLLDIAADDSFEVYVNGELAGRGEGWQHFSRLDISKFVGPGNNAVAVKVVNLATGHAGLAAQIRVGSQHVISTDASWRTSVLPLRRWKHTQFADQTWRPAMELGAWGKTAPWIVSSSDVPTFYAAQADAAEVGMTERNAVDPGEVTSRVVPAAAEEVIIEEFEELAEEPPFTNTKAAPKILRPMQQARPLKPRFDADQPGWSMEVQTGSGPQQIRNPFIRQRRSIQTETEVGSPDTPILPRIDVPKPATLRPTPNALPDKITTTQAPEAAVPEASVKAPALNSRFSPFKGFSVEEVLPADQTGSLIAATFNEFGQYIVSREGGPLMICTDSDQDGQFDEVSEYCKLVTNCQGILALSGMVFVVADGAEGMGLYRLSDPGRQGKLDQAVLLVKFDVSAKEHGPHGITLGPDGRLYISCGNHTSLDREFSKTSPRRHLYEGDLIPRYEDPGGHANGIQVPAGFVLRTDTEGKQLDLFASGLRNVYDLAFTSDGELFCHDSDMESDISTAWYRPTQIYFVPPGSEFGWRSGWSKWPEHFLDVTPPIAQTGRGSPTGAVVYNHYAYPAPFRDVLFLADWSRGRILVAKPVRKGAGVQMETDTFLEGRPLNVTDLDIGPDGLLYFVTGGRGSKGGVFRVRWNGQPNQQPTVSNPIQQALTAPQINSAWGRQRVAVIQQQMGNEWKHSLIAAAQDTALPVEQRVQAIQLMQWVGPLPTASLLLKLSEDKQTRVRSFAAYLLGLTAADERVPLRLVEMLADSEPRVRRQACESLVRANRSVPFEYLAPLLGSQDRAEVSAARLLLQLDHPDEWLTTAWTTKDPRVFLQSATALMVAWPSEARARQVVTKSLELMKGYMSDDDFIDLLRVLQLAVLRGELQPDSVPELKVALADEFPASHHIMNRELIRLMIRLQISNIKSRYLDHLDTELPEEERIHLATHLRFLETEWTMEDKLRLFKHLKPSSDAGGSVAGYLENVARDFSKGSGSSESSQILKKGALVPGAALEAVMQLPHDLSTEQIEQLVQLDQSVTATDDLSKKLKVAVLAVLARSGEELAMSHLRNVYDNEPGRRVECTIGLAEQPDGPNWPYLVKSLSVVNGQIAQDIIQKLRTVDRSPTDSEAYRQLIMAGLRLGDDGGDEAVRLLEQWRGFAPSDETPPWSDALRAWQNWFKKTYPSDPLPELTHRKQQEKWDYNKLIQHLGKTNVMRAASAERGKHIFVQAQCAKCHQHGSLGESMGPNLTSLSSRFHLREIVESMMYPSKVVSDQYKSKTLITTEGLAYTGIVGSGGPDALVVLQADGEKIRVAADAVEQTVPSTTSAMPEGLLDGLSLQEVTDLVAFLQLSDERVADGSTGESDTTRSR